MELVLSAALLLNFIALFLFSKRLQQIEEKVDNNLRQIEMHLTNIDIDDVYYKIHEKPKEKSEDKP